MKQVPYRGLTSHGRHCTKFCRHGARVFPTPVLKDNSYVGCPVLKSNFPRFLDSQCEAGCISDEDSM